MARGARLIARYRWVLGGGLTAFIVGYCLWLVVTDAPAYQLETWEKMGFVVEAEGTILCFIIYLIPGLPKDMVCYLFGLSPMPFWVFTLVSTLGRIPGTWALSAQGAKAAGGHYTELLLLSAMLAAIAIPLYYYRSQIVSRFRGRATGHNP